MSKKYLVTEATLDRAAYENWDWERLKEWVRLSELPPDAVMLTREQVEKLIRIRWLKEEKSSEYLQQECNAIYLELMQTLDELFGKTEPCPFGSRYVDKLPDLPGGEE